MIWLKAQIDYSQLISENRAKKGGQYKKRAGNFWFPALKLKIPLIRLSYPSH